MCRCEKHQTIFSSKLFVLYVNQYKIVSYGQIPLQKATFDQTIVIGVGETYNADFSLFCFAASFIKNYEAVNFGSRNPWFNNKHSCFSKMALQG